jgi:hypothetical protein
MQVQNGYKYAIPLTISGVVAATAAGFGIARFISINPIHATVTTVGLCAGEAIPRLIYGSKPTLSGRAKYLPPIINAIAIGAIIFGNLAVNKSLVKTFTMIGVAFTAYKIVSILANLLLLPFIRQEQMPKGAAASKVKDPNKKSLRKEKKATGTAATPVPTTPRESFAANPFLEADRKNSSASQNTASPSPERGGNMGGRYRKQQSDAPGTPAAASAVPSAGKLARQERLLDLQPKPSDAQAASAGAPSTPAPGGDKSKNGDRSPTLVPLTPVNGASVSLSPASSNGTASPLAGSPGSAAETPNASTLPKQDA